MWPGAVIWYAALRITNSHTKFKANSLASATHQLSHPQASGASGARRQLAAWAAHEAKAARKALAAALADLPCVVLFAWGLSHAVTALWVRGQGLAALAWPVAAILSALALRAVLTILAQRLNGDFGRRIVSHVRLDILDKALAGRVDAAADAPGLNALFEDSESLEAYYTRFHGAQVQAAVFPLALVAVMAVASPICAGLIAATLLPFVALMAILGLQSAEVSKRQLDALARLSNLFVDRLRTLPLILAFDAGPRQVRAVARAADTVAERTLSVLKVAFLTSAVLEFFSALSVALIAVYCGFYLLGLLPFAVPEHLTLEKAFFVLALSPEVYAPVRRLSAAYHDRQQAMAAAQRLMALTIQPETPAMPRLGAAPAIAYQNVTCGFADDPEFRIGPVSFSCAAGDVVAVQGPSGSGKTTLLRLLLGQGLRRSGGIAIDGRQLEGALAESIGWMGQATPILAGSLRDNLMLARRDASEADLARAVDLAGLAPLVAARGLDAPLDERGTGLSGGERRRIGLARAILKDAPLLLLDEPTADLDADSASALIALLPAIFAGRTVILSSHDPRLCALAIQQVVLA